MQAPPSHSASLPARRALLLYLGLFLALSAAGWLPEIAGRLGASWVSADYSALFHPTDTFASAGAYEDLTDFGPAFAHLSVGSLTGLHLAPFPYPPVAAWVFALLLRGFRNPVAACLVGLAVTLLAAFALLGRTLTRRAGLLGGAVALATLLLGSPQYFTADRANIEWLSCAFTVAGVLAFLRRQTLVAAVLIGMAAAIKPFPLIFLALLLWHGRYRQAALALGVAVAVSVAALASIGPDIASAAHPFRAGLAEYFARYVVLIRPAQEFRFNHSLLDALKVPIWFLFEHQRFDPRPLTAATPGVPLWARMDLWAKLNAAFAFAALAFLGWLFRRKPLLNQVFALTVAELLLPYSASEYTLLLLYLPWGLLLVVLTSKRPPPLTVAQWLGFLLPCAALFAPLSFMSVFSGFTKTALLVYLFVQVAGVLLRAEWDREWEREGDGSGLPLR